MKLSRFYGIRMCSISEMPKRYNQIKLNIALNLPMQISVINFEINFYSSWISEMWLPVNLFTVAVVNWAYRWSHLWPFWLICNCNEEIWEYGGTYNLVFSVIMQTNEINSEFRNSVYILMDSFHSWFGLIKRFDIRTGIISVYKLKNINIFCFSSVISHMTYFAENQVR